MDKLQRMIRIDQFSSSDTSSAIRFSNSALQMVWELPPQDFNA
jgi:hypothetical protein